MKVNTERGGGQGMRVSMAILGLVAVMVLAACAKDDVTPAAGGSGGSVDQSSASSPDASSANSGGGRYGYGSGGGGGGSGGSGEDISKADAVVKASDFQFSPGTVTIESGEVLGIANSSAATAHTFTIDSEGIDEALDPGSSTSLTIDLAPGRYPFICRYHESTGMTGTLVVT